MTWHVLDSTGEAAASFKSYKACLNWCMKRPSGDHTIKRPAPIRSVTVSVQIGDKTAESELI